MADYVNFWKLPAAQYNPATHGKGIFQCSDTGDTYIFGILNTSLSEENKSKVEKIIQGISQLGPVTHVMDENAFIIEDGQVKLNFECVDCLNSPEGKSEHKKAIPEATTSQNGLLSASDKAKISELYTKNEIDQKLTDMTPSIGENGNWFVGGVDSGVPSKGADGVSLGEIALVQTTGTSTESVMSQNAVTEKFSELDSHINKMTTEYNVSLFHSTEGIDGSNKYTLEMAIVKVPESLRNVGIKCSFLDDGGKLQTWEYLGGAWAAGSFSQVGTAKLSELEAEIVGYIRGYYVSRDGGKITSFRTLCYTEITYIDGDEIIVDGAQSGERYDKYNFFEDETFISSSNELSSIPENCNKIKINGNASVGITVTINGEGANLISQVEENKQGIEENKQGIEENKQGIEENKQGIDSLNLNVDGVIFGSFINRSGIKASFRTLCYTEITYIDGDEIIADGAQSGEQYDKYNFFEDETFISSSNELSSIPENCNKIKINGNASVGITVTINGEGANTYSKIKKIETEVEELGNEVETNITVLADTVSETANNVDNIISDESVKKQYVNLQDNVNVLSDIFNNSPNINYIPSFGYNMKATSVFGAKTKLPFNYTSGKRVALCATIFFNQVTDDFLFQFGFNSSGWDKRSGDIKASDYGLSNFTGTTQTFALIWDATKASNLYFYVYKSEVAPGQTEEYTIKNFAVVDMGSNAEENELYNLTAEKLVEIFKYSQVKGNDIQYKNLIVRIAEEAKKISLDAFLQREKFYRKKLITIGDSLTANCIWQPRLCNLTGLVWSEDETKNGVGYVNKNTGEYTTEDKDSDPNYRKAYKMAIGGTGTRPTSVDSIYMRSFDAKFYNPEIILIYTGQNDPVSTWKTLTNPGTTPYEIVENEVPYKDNEINGDVSVISAYRGMVENLMKDIPSAIIYLVTQMRVLGVVGMEQASGGIRFNTQQDVVDWEFSGRYPKVEYIRAIGKLYGLPVIDLWDKSGITDYNSEYWYGEPASDCTQVHPKAIGYYRMADVMEQSL